MRTILAAAVLFGAPIMAKAQPDVKALQAEVERLKAENAALRVELAAAKGVKGAAPKAAPAGSPWTDKITYLQFDKSGKEVFRRENVDACRAPSGKWVIRYGQVGVTLYVGDAIITPDGKTLKITRHNQSPFGAGGSNDHLETVPLPEAPKPKK